MHGAEEGQQNLQHSGGAAGYYPPEEGGGQGSGLMGRSSGSFHAPEDRTKSSTYPVRELYLLSTLTAAALLRYRCDGGLGHVLRRRD
jgi:hypothetical protein